MEFFKSKKVVIYTILVWIIVILTISYWKYVNFLFNGFDLAIYNQALFNTVNGNPMNVSIHPHNYFGDHFEPILFLLTPVYYFFSHPLTLIVIQTLVIGFTAYAIYLIAKLKLSHHWSALLAIGWLLNPFTNATALFEFHALVFGFCALVWAVYYYLQNKYWPWLLFIILALISREDISLSVVAFGLVAIIDKKSLRWYLPTILGGLIWYYGAMKIITYFSPDNQYKFLYYYQWLGSSLSEIFLNIIKKPWLILLKLIHPENILLLLTLLMPTLFVAVRKPKWLLIALPSFLAYTLTGSNNVSVVFISHYGFALLPGLFIASIDSVAVITDRVKKSLLTNNLLYLLIVVAILYSSITLGLGKTFYDLYTENVITSTPAKFLNVDKSKSVVSSFGLLANYSNRQSVFSLHYLLTGHKQLSNQVFNTPITDHVVLDRGDMIHFSAFSPNTEFWAKWWPSIPLNLRTRLNQYSLTSLTDYALFTKEKNNNPFLVEEIKGDGQFATTSEPTLVAVNVLPNNNITPKNFSLYSLTIHCSQPSTNNKIITVVETDNQGKKKIGYYPYLWGLWRANECEENTTYKQLLALPTTTNTKKIEFNLVNANLQTKINGAGVLTFSISDEQIISSYSIDKT